MRHRPVLPAVLAPLALALPLALAACGADAGAADGSAAASGSSAAATSAPSASSGASSGTPSGPSSGAPSGSSSGAPSGPTSGAASDPLPGAYLTLSGYSEAMAARAGTKVVYFFHAPWCPDCRATEKSLESEGVPAGLTVVKVDFDTAIELRQRLGVTQQHTFVEIDGAGEPVAKWTGSRSGADIAGRAA
jgi:thiol-disulfide isomerase/thioredoxin